MTDIPEGEDYFIPKDIMKAASDAIDECWAPGGHFEMTEWDKHQRWDDWEYCIARIILAERERCASICDREAEDWHSEAGGRNQERAVLVCADAIRKGEA